MVDDKEIGTSQNNVRKTAGNRNSRGRSFRPTNYIKPQNKYAIWYLREDQRTQSLPEAKLTIVVEAIEKHNTRLKQRGKDSQIIKNTKMLKAELQADREAAVFKLVKEFYRTAKGRWVGGKTEVEVSIGMTPAASGSSTTEWDSDHRWSGCNAELSVTIQPTWLSQIANVPGLASAGGRLNTHAEQVGPDLWKASWVEQGRGFDLKSVSGYLLLADGEFYHGKSEIQVRRAYKRAARIKRETELARARGEIHNSIWKGEDVLPAFLVDFPELTSEVNRMVQEKRRFDAEAALTNNELVDMDKIAEFPDLVERYHQQRQEMFIQRLRNGEDVDMQELAEYPALLMNYSDLFQ